MLRNIPAIDTPFQASRDAFLALAKIEMPERCTTRTGSRTTLAWKRALHIPATAGNALIFVLGENGHIVRRIEGRPDV